MAVTYFELRCGRLPFDSESHYLMAKVHTEGQLDLAALPETERQVIAKAVSVQLQDRYPTASQMVQQLRQTLDSD
ncbi:MAG: hypothetical protein MI861_21610 [Pirellulales bacterium]|nr:hypothetical protein [Pirellulales bacterium]